MSKPQNNLLNELQAAGASSREASDLTQLAGQLSHLKSDARDYRSLGLVALVLAVAVILVSVAQYSLPGNWLYGVKKASESSLALVDPSFKGNMMIRRSSEVKQLVADHASNGAVLATLADYNSEAAAYRSTNYAVFAHCRANLQQAATVAPPTQQRAIMATINSISVIPS